ncbi:uncharacterized protein G2W53_028058 [Senna tora]|uniref:Uncharacterized protein n=1 Tax=Senna tora TaxID=362788 RepID=A0A834T1H0_9FABA|nr:uncharacterized protein G2W53_028058 [Senna tora]
MELFRSKSCKNQSFEMGTMEAPRGMKDLRCHSVNYPPQRIKMEKGNLGKSSKSWSFSDPELQRKKRVAGYKVYAVEGKMKGSLRKSFKWIKNTYTQALNGSWWLSMPLRVESKFLMFDELRPEVLLCSADMTDKTPSLAIAFLLRVGSDEDQPGCLPSSPPTIMLQH